MRKIGPHFFAFLTSEFNRRKYSTTNCPPLLEVAPYLVQEEFSDTANALAHRYRECNVELTTLLSSKKLLTDRIVNLMDTLEQIRCEVSKAGMSEAEVDYLIRVAESTLDINEVYPCCNAEFKECYY